MLNTKQLLSCVVDLVLFDGTRSWLLCLVAISHRIMATMLGVECTIKYPAKCLETVQDTIGGPSAS